MRRPFINVLALGTLSLIDRGVALTIDEFEAKCHAGTIIRWLREQKPWLDDVVQDVGQDTLIADALDRWVTHNNPAKYMIEDSGLCLMVAFLWEISRDEGVD